MDILEISTEYILNQVEFFLKINEYFTVKSFKVGFNVGLEQLYEILNSLDKYGMSLENEKSMRFSLLKKFSKNSNF